MNEKKHWHLYVLKLEQGKFYVGITSKTVERRMQEHRRGYSGAAWTRKYKPLNVYYSKDLGVISESRAEAFENKVVREYIQKYGIDNVRGGDLSNTDDMVIRANRIFEKEGWETAIVILMLLLLIMYLVVKMYFS